MVDVLKPCKAAAREIDRRRPITSEIADELLRLGPDWSAITLGADGCLIASSRESRACSGFQSERGRYDGRGRRIYGRAFLRIVARLGTGRVGIFANACAALCCTKVGARAMAKRR